MFSPLDPELFQNSFAEWTLAVAALLPGVLVAIDGKTVRRSYDKKAGRQAIHLVSAWASPEPADGLPGIPGYEGRMARAALGSEGGVPSKTESGASVQTRYYLSSLEVSAERQLAAAQGHWSIENSLHWTMDVTFREDQNRVRKDHGPQNMAAPRQISRNLLKQETSLKVGI